MDRGAWQATGRGEPSGALIENKILGSPPLVNPGDMCKSDPIFEVWTPSKQILPIVEQDPDEQGEKKKKKTMAENQHDWSLLGKWSEQKRLVLRLSADTSHQFFTPLVSLLYTKDGFSFLKCKSLYCV